MVKVSIILIVLNVIMEIGLFALRPIIASQPSPIPVPSTAYVYSVLLCLCLLDCDLRSLEVLVFDRGKGPSNFCCSYLANTFNPQQRGGPYPSNYDSTGAGKAL